MGFLDQIEPLKQSHSRSCAPRLIWPRWRQGARSISWIEWPVHRLLLKQLGTLSKDEKPAAGKANQHGKAELEVTLADRRQELELKGRPASGTHGLHLAGPPAATRKTSSLTQVTEDIVRSFRKNRIRRGRWSEVRMNTTVSMRSTRGRRIRRATRRIRFTSIIPEIPNPKSESGAQLSATPNLHVAAGVRITSSSANPGEQNTPPIRIHRSGLGFIDG